MKRAAPKCALAVVVAALGAGRPAEAQDLQQKAAAAKQAAEANQQVLRSYSWISKTEISLKGEVKNTKIESCRYGGDGKVLKTPMSEPPPPQKMQRGLKGRVIEKKTDELKEDMQAAMTAGKITMVPGAGTSTLTIADYEKAGDSLVLTLDTAAKGMKQIAVDTWKDSPSDKVTLNVEMQSLPDGTSYPGAVVLAIRSSNVQVRITNSHYQKLAQ